MLVLSICLVSSACMSVDSELLYNQAKEYGPYDVIIVPGYPINGRKINNILKSRILWSYYLFQEGVTKNIIYSGGAIYTPYYEAKVMAMYAEGLGIPKERIFEETRARHSAENIYYSYQYAKDLGFDKVALATDPYQLKYSMGFREKFDLDYDFIPIIYSKIKLLEIEEPDLKFERAYHPEFKSIVNESWLKRIKGTMGLNIVDE